VRDIVLLRGVDRRAFDQIVERSVELIRAATDLPAPDVEVWRHAGSGLALIQSSASAAIERLPLHQDRREAFAYSGFVATAAFAPSEVRRLISIDGDPAMVRSPGGIATYFLADARSGRILAWSSHAGMEGPYFTIGPDCTAISNRPLLSHVVGRQTDRPAMSSRWAHRALLGSGLWDDTPFEGTLQPPPRTAIVVADDGVRFASHPVPLSRRYGERDPAGVEALRAAALEAVAPLRRWPRGELWLSGGKDSRFAAALLLRAGIDIDVLTHARADAGEGEAAAAVARALGLDHRITDAGGIATGEQLLPTIVANLRRSDGLLGEVRHLAYRAAPHLGGPLVQGQAHHPRGGYKVKLPATRESMEEHLVEVSVGEADLVTRELVDERHQRLRDILGGYSAPGHPCELAYWLYSDWRMTRWTSAAYRSASHSRPVVWPMMDERVLEVTAGLAPLDRVQEIAFFAALVALHPELGRVPLYEDTWKFDSSKLGSETFPDGHDVRRSPFREKGRGRTAERRFSTIQPLFRRALLEMRSGSELQRLVRPEVFRALCDEEDPAVALGQPHMQVINFMWKATVVALVLEGSWHEHPATDTLGR
jgi:hypothetical protein